RGGVAAAGDEGASAGGLRLGGARAVGAFVRVRLPKRPPPGGGRFDETSGRPRSSLARRLPRRSEPLGRSASSRERNAPAALARRSSGAAPGRPCSLRPCSLRPCSLRPCSLRPCSLRPCSPGPCWVLPCSPRLWLPRPCLPRIWAARPSLAPPGERRGRCLGV